MGTNMRKSVLAVFLPIFCLATQGLAHANSTDGQENQAHKEAHHGKSADEVARELNNPASSLSFLTIKNQFRIYDGDLPDAEAQWNYTLLFQPVFPFPLGESPFSDGKANLFVRPAIPVLVEQPVPTVSGGGFGYDHITVLGDISFDLAYGVTEKSGLIWLAGMLGTLPTATDGDVAGQQFRLGPEVFVGKGYKWGLVGIFPQHQWDVAGYSDGSDESFSTTQIEPVVKLNLGDGWVAGTQPIIQYDWIQEQWNVPLNLLIGKTVALGKMPLRVELELDYYVERPDAFAPKWLIGLNITPVVPNFINNWIRGK